MNKIKLFFSDLSKLLDLENWARKVIFVLGLVLLTTTIINIASILHETKRTKGQVFARDNDAGRGIQTATLTRWWNSNHFAPYGNLYFRFAHTIAKLAPSDVPESVHPKEQEELVHHFALLLTSLFLLTALCLTCAYLLLGTWTGALWVANVFLYLGIQDSTWVEFLFRAHPDHTLMFFSLIASYFTLRYTNSETRRDFIMAGLMWGIATAVKRSTILFIPSFLYLFLSEGLNRRSLVKGIQFIGFMLLSYLIVGFPQNFGFYKHIKFLYIETFNSRPPTMHSAYEYLQLIFTQSKYFWLAFFPLHLFFGRQERLMNRRFVIFAIMAVLVVLTGNMSSSHNHHIMPHVALLFVLVIYTIKYLPVLNFRRKNLLLAVISSIVLLTFPSRFSALEVEKNHQLSCSSEIKSALKIVNEIQLRDKVRLIRDPYFPFSAETSDLTKQIWGVGGADLDRENAGLWGTQKGFIKALIKKGYRPHIYDLTADEWENKMAFNRLAISQDNLTTPNGIVFEKIYEDACEFMIWKRK